MAEGINENFTVTHIAGEWKIPHFFPLSNDSYCVTLPAITFLDARWTVIVHKADEFYEMHFWGKIFTTSSTQRVYYTIGIKNADGSIYKSVNGMQYMIQAYEPTTVKGFIRRDILMRDKMDIAPDDTLVVFCSLSLNRNTSLNPLANAVIQTENAAGLNYNLKEDLERLFRNGTHFDTTIKVCEREFKVHKAILGARSPVFQSMFSDDTAERNTAIIEIRNCDPEVFEYFLLFLYCEKLEQLSPKNAMQVYELAEKYRVDEMKTAYVNIIKCNLSVDNFCDIVDIALKYDEPELLKSSAKFFSGNSKEILVSNKWQCFLKLHPAEANELLIKAMECRDNE